MKSYLIFTTDLTIMLIFSSVYESPLLSLCSQLVDHCFTFAFCFCIEVSISDMVSNKLIRLFHKTSLLALHYYYAFRVLTHYRIQLATKGICSFSFTECFSHHILYMYAVNDLGCHNTLQLTIYQISSIYYSSLTHNISSKSSLTSNGFQRINNPLFYPWLCHSVLVG